MWYEKTALVLAAIGAINWGLDVIGWDLIEKLISSWSPVFGKVVYIVVALCGVYALVKAFK
jgi:uncharacterized membrane protein YuzA (DUF378 family)